MAQRFLTSIDLSKNELQNAKIQNLASAPSSPVAGQIYFDTTDSAFKYYNGTAWITVQDGDITSVNAGLGLTGGGDSGAVTLSAAVDGNTIQFATLGELYVGDNSITSQQLDATGVAAGAYGAPTQIPIITVSEDGRITDASFAPISSTLTISDGTASDAIQIGTDTLTFASSADVDVSVTDNTVNVGLPDSGVASNFYGGPGAIGFTVPKIFVNDKGIITLASETLLAIGGTANEIDVLDFANGNYQIGLPDDVTIANNLTVNGNLTVSGTTTTVNTETILLADNIIELNSNASGLPTENAGIEVNRGLDAPAGVIWNESTDKWELQSPSYTLNQNIATEDFVNESLYSNSFAHTINGDASTSSFVINYPASFNPSNLLDVMIQVVDSNTAETVHVDVQRDPVSATINFAQAPGVGGDYRVLVTKIG